MSKNTNSSNHSKLKNKIIQKMQELFNGKTINSKNPSTEALDMTLSDNLNQSTLHDNLKVNYAEVESLKQIIYSEANKDLTTKLEDMKRQYMLQNPDFNSNGHFTQTGIYDKSKNEDIQAMIHITNDGKVDLLFMCADNRNISYHKDENDNFEYSEERQGANGKNSVVEISSKYGLYGFNTYSYSNHHSPEQVAQAKYLSKKFSNPNNALKKAESSIPEESMDNYQALRKKLGVRSIKTLDSNGIEKEAAKRGLSPQEFANQGEKVAVIRIYSNSI